jgi:hypothetical protein
MLNVFCALMKLLTILPLFFASVHSDVPGQIRSTSFLRKILRDPDNGISATKIGRQVHYITQGKGPGSALKPLP